MKDKLSVAVLCELLLPVVRILNTVAQLVKALCYKPEGRGFDFR
jgi:2-keto-3-deoxy-L-rhamnonate aldolase RhmA